MWIDLNYILSYLLLGVGFVGSLSIVCFAASPDCWCSRPKNELNSSQTRFALRCVSHHFFSFIFFQSDFELWKHAFGDCGWLCFVKYVWPSIDFVFVNKI